MHNNVRIYGTIFYPTSLILERQHFNTCAQLVVFAVNVPAAKELLQILCQLMSNRSFSDTFKNEVGIIQNQRINCYCNPSLYQIKGWHFHFVTVGAGFTRGTGVCFSTWLADAHSASLAGLFL